MRKLAVVGAMLMILGAFSVPVYAMGMGGGMSGGMGGGGMTGNFGSRLWDWFQGRMNGSAYAGPSGQDREQMEQLNRDHNEDSAYLRYQIQMEEKELDALLHSSNPDLEKARTLSRDIRELRAEADREQRNYELQAGKITPGYRSGDGGGWGSSYGSAGRGSAGMGGYGGGMMGYGQGR